MGKPKISLINPDYLILTENLSRLERTYPDHYTVRKFSPGAVFNQYFPEKKKGKGNMTYIDKGTYSPKKKGLTN